MTSNDDAAIRDLPSGNAVDESPAGSPAGLVRDPGEAPGRVDAGEAVTGTRGIPGGEAPPGGVPGDDGSIEAERPVVAEPGEELPGDPEA